MRTLVVVALVVVALAVCGACAPAPKPRGCTSQAGNPTLLLGHGHDGFAPAANGERWVLAGGPQGGNHLWLSMRAPGFAGPTLVLSLDYLEPDGTPLGADVLPVAYCAADTVEYAGIRAPVPDEQVNRVACGGPFVLNVSARDRSGTAEGSRLVAGVDADPDAPPHADCSAGG